MQPPSEPRTCPTKLTRSPNSTPLELSAGLRLSTLPQVKGKPFPWDDSCSFPKNERLLLLRQQRKLRTLFDECKLERFGLIMSLGKCDVKLQTMLGLRDIMSTLFAILFKHESRSVQCGCPPRCRQALALQSRATQPGATEVNSWEGEGRLLQEKNQVKTF